VSEPTDYGCVTFETTQSAIRAEKALKGAGYFVKLIPTPRELSADCGVCIRFAWAQRAEVERALAAAGVAAASVARLPGETRRRQDG
jgi:hypothetical protein